VEEDGSPHLLGSDGTGPHHASHSKNHQNQQHRHPNRRKHFRPQQQQNKSNFIPKKKEENQQHLPLEQQQPSPPKVASRKNYLSLTLDLLCKGNDVSFQWIFKYYSFSRHCTACLFGSPSVTPHVKAKAKQVAHLSTGSESQ
jgi:hypothetical protein